LRVLKDANTTTPIVGMTSDPVGHGLVASLARPGANMTGVSLDAGMEILGKRLELLREIAPNMIRVGYLAPLPGWEGLHQQAMQGLAQNAAMKLVGPPLQSPINETEYRRVFEAMAQAHVDAVFVSDYGENFTHRAVIAQLAAEHRFPTIHPYGGYVEVGGLMEYATDLGALWRELADLTIRILNGQSPVELPFRQPSKFSLRLNAKTANALGLTIPPTLLARADEVIE
jgi:putative ABC transport system substrate-binding protein